MSCCRGIDSLCSSTAASGTVTHAGPVTFRGRIRTSGRGSVIGIVEETVESFEFFVVTDGGSSRSGNAVWTSV